MNSCLDALLVRIGRPDGIWFQPNPGNAGDSLLAIAARQKFQRLGIEVHEIAPGFDATGKVVVYGGGGNLVRYYRFAADFLERHHEQARHLVVLPHSVDGHEDLLGKLGQNVTVVCREKVSYRHCLSHARGAEVILGHDLVIEMDPASLQPWATSRHLLVHAVRHSLLSGEPVPDRIHYLRKVGGAVRSLVRGRFHHHAPGDPLLAFRSDVESLERHVPEENADLSELLMLHDSTGRNAELGGRLMLGILSRHRSVATDRLHIAIAGGLLGLSVDFRPNSYYKCAAVWEHSLKNRFPNIRWHGPVAPQFETEARSGS